VSYALKKIRKIPRPSGPSVRSSEGVGQDEHGQRDEADEHELNDVEDGEPGRDVEHGPDRRFRLGMENLEYCKQKGRQEQQYET
jgi:hypothetical protein